MGEAIVDAVRGAVLAACFIRYMDALRLGDNYASATSLTAYDVAYQHTTGSEMDHMTRRWGVENPAGLDPERVDRDRRLLDGHGE